MNPAHLHLLLNHVAILGTIFSAVVFTWGIFGKSKSIQTVALAGFVFAALAAIPVFLSGEGAEEAVEKLAGVSKSHIEAHEESADVALWLTEILGALSLLLLLAERRNWKLAYRLPVPILLLSLVASGSIAYTGYIGGKIHHTEIYSPQSQAGSTEQKGDQEDND